MFDPTELNRPVECRKIFNGRGGIYMIRNRIKIIACFCLIILVNLIVITPFTYAIADITKPTITISSPGSGQSVTKGNTVTISATATDNVSVSGMGIYLDGSSSKEATSYNGSISYNWNTSNLSAGSHTIKVTAVDPSNNAIEKNISITIVAADTTKPTITISSPSSGQSITKGNTVTISAAATDNVSVSGMGIYLDGSTSKAATTYNGSISYNWDTSNLSTGSHTIKVTAVDTSNNASEKSIGITITAVPAQLSAPTITEPSSDNADIALGVLGGFTVKWNPVSGAERYMVALRDKDNLYSFTDLQVHDTQCTISYVGADLKAGYSYTLEVSAVRGTESSKRSLRIVDIIPPTPKILTPNQTEVDINNIDISWDPVYVGASQNATFKISFIDLTSNQAISGYTNKQITATSFSLPPSVATLNHNYRVELVAVSNGVDGGKASREFTVTQSNDTGKPQVITTTPLDGATCSVALGTLTVEFNEEILAGPSISSISVAEAGMNSLGISPHVQGKVLTLDISSSGAPFQAGKTYIVKLPAGTVKDTSGNGCEAYQFNFSIDASGDGSSPYVVSSNPTNGQKNVSSTQTIMITFNEAVVKQGGDRPVTISNALYGDATLKTSQTLDQTSKILTISRTDGQGWGAGLEYTVSLPFAKIKDSAGNEMAHDFSFTFIVADVNSSDPAVLEFSVAPKGTITPGQQVSISGKGSNCNRMKILIDGVEKHSSNSTSISYPWNTTGVTVGTHTISIYAYNTTTNKTTSKDLSVTLNTVGSDPTVKIDGIYNGAEITKGDIVNINGSGTNCTAMAIRIDGQKVTPKTSTATSITYPWDTTNVAIGRHTISVNAYNSITNKNIPRDVTVTIKAVPAPIITVKSPIEGIPYPKGNIRIIATAINAAAMNAYFVKADGTEQPMFGGQILGSSIDRLVPIAISGNYKIKITAINSKSVSAIPKYINIVVGDQDVKINSINPKTINAGESKNPKVTIYGSGFIGSAAEVDVVTFNLRGSSQVFNAIAFDCVDSGRIISTLPPNMPAGRYDVVVKKSKTNQISRLEDKFEIKPIAPPTELKATPVSPSQIVLTWKAVSGAATYIVSRASSAAGPFLQINTSTVTNPRYNDTGLVTGKTYYYQVQAVNSTGKSEYSSVASEKTILPLKVISTAPQTNSTYNNASTLIQITFNNPIIAWDTSKILVSTSSDRSNPVAISVASSGSTLKITPNQSLRDETMYYVTLKAGAAKDTSGVTLSTNYNFYFKTKANIWQYLKNSNNQNLKHGIITDDKKCILVADNMKAIKNNDKVNLSLDIYNIGYCKIGKGFFSDYCPSYIDAVVEIYDKNNKLIGINIADGYRISSTVVEGYADIISNYYEARLYDKNDYRNPRFSEHTEVTTENPLEIPEYGYITISKGDNIALAYNLMRMSFDSFGVWKSLNSSNDQDDVNEFILSLYEEVFKPIADEIALELASQNISEEQAMKEAFAIIKAKAMVKIFDWIQHKAFDVSSDVVNIIARELKDELKEKGKEALYTKLAQNLTVATKLISIFETSSAAIDLVFQAKDLIYNYCYVPKEYNSLKLSYSYILNRINYYGSN